MNNDYTIDEILKAINDLNDLNKNKKKTKVIQNPKKQFKGNIPDYTMKLIEEAEKSKIE
tara:strand:+ start:2637 stop:2813 length:177 start_codon:yes stop_codon:yes gene_type:complete